MHTLKISRSISKNKKLFWGSIICGIGALFYCYEFVLRIVPGALQPQLSLAFGNISATAFGQLSALYYFAYSPMQLPVGMLMDRYGPKRLLTLACFCCTLGTWLFINTSSLSIAGTGRFLMGFGSSFAFVGVLSLALHWLPPRYFSSVAGLITTLGMMGIMYGEVKLTEIAMNVSWEYALWGLIAIGILLTIIIFFIVQDSPEEASFPHQQDNLKEFLKNVWFVLCSGQVWLIGLVGACLYTSLSVFGELWGKTYLEQVHHLTQEQAAKTISALFLGWAVGAPLAGYLSDWTRKRTMPLVIGAFGSLIFISIVLYYPGLPYFALFCLLFLYGLFSATEIIIFIMAKENSGAKLSGTVFAVTNMIVTLGGVIFQPLVGILLDLAGDNKLIGGEHIYTTLDYHIALSILPISLLIVTILAFFMKDAA